MTFSYHESVRLVFRPCFAALRQTPDLESSSVEDKILPTNLHETTLNLLKYCILYCVACLVLHIQCIILL